MARRSIFFVLALICFAISPAGALDISSIGLVVDSAPNVYGSPAWAPWWTQTKADVVAGTFTDMRTGTLPGTHSMDPYDEIVYSTGDLGKRLHWIYWLPGVTKTDLAGRFEVKWVIDWGGDDWTYSGGNWAVDGAEVGWSQPSSWEDYSGGVIGSVGFAWWATDDEALPFSTGGSIYDEVDQADIDALRQEVFQNQTFARGMIRYRDTGGDWQNKDLQLNMVPEPSSLFLVGAVMLGSVAFARYRRRKR